MFCWISWLHVDRFSWDFYNRDSFDETIKILLYLEDLFYHTLLMRLSKISCIWKTFSIILCLLHSIFTHTHIHTYIHTFGFIEKTSVKQDLNCKVCSNLQMFFLHLVRRTQNRWGFRSGWHFCQIFRLHVRLTFGQTYAHHQALGQVDIWSHFGSGWPLVRCPLKIRLWSGWHLGNFGSG